MTLVRSIKQLVVRLVRSAFAEVRTHTPAQVSAYDATRNACTVQPAVRRLRMGDPANMTTVDAPELTDVPVLQRGNGKVWLTAAPRPDSYGLLHVSDRELEQWLTAGGLVDPHTLRQFDLSDAVFEPGLLPFVADGDNGMLVEPVRTDRIELRTRSGLTAVAVLEDENIVIHTENASVEIDPDGNVAVTAEGDVDVTSNGGDITLDNGTQSLAIGATVDAGAASDYVAMATKVDTLWTTLYTLLTTWVPVPMDGGAAFKTAALLAFPAPPTSVASGNLKAE